MIRLAIKGREILASFIPACQASLLHLHAAELRLLSCAAWRAWVGVGLPFPGMARGPAKCEHPNLSQLLVGTVQASR
jgi:hypothetical protein